MGRLPSLKAVQYFDAAARHKSFTVAAQELHVTQSAVSRMVQSLEDELQVQLFSRNGRFIALTTDGHEYHKEVSEALDRIAQASRRLQRHVEDQAFNVGVNPAFATRWLVPRLSQFQRAHPHIHINLISNEIDSPSAAKDATVWIRYGSGPWPNVDSTLLPIDAPLSVVCAPELLRRYGELQRPEDLLGKPLLAYTGGLQDLWQEFFEHFQLPASALAQARRFQQLLTLAEAAVSGLGFALVPLFLMEPELKSGRLVKALPQTFESCRKHFIIHSKGAERDKKVQLFKRWVLSQAKKNLHQ